MVDDVSRLLLVPVHKKPKSQPAYSGISMLGGLPGVSPRLCHATRCNPSPLPDTSTNSSLLPLLQVSE